MCSCQGDETIKAQHFIPRRFIPKQSKKRMPLITYFVFLKLRSLQKITLFRVHFFLRFLAGIALLLGPKSNQWLLAFETAY